MADTDPGKALSQASNQFTNIVQDLFKIEVNIILRDNITAQKMPNPRHALLDIGKEYCKALEEMEIWRRHHRSRTRRETFLVEKDVFANMRQRMGYLTEEEAATQTIDASQQGRIVSPNVADELGGFDAFDVIRNWADSLLDDLEKESYLSPAQLAVLPRIKDNSDLIKGMYSAICLRDPVLNDPQQQTSSGNLAMRLAEMSEDDMTPNTVVEESKRICKALGKPEHAYDLTNEYTRSDLVNRAGIKPLPLRDSDLVMIRKVWELGTEVIAMQTIVQVDGDVITRLNPDYMNEEAYPRLHEYHNKGVNIALEHWSNLVNVAKELIIAAAKGISNRVRA
ncbi:MAG: hypothetical protein CSB13_09775 [Chloroflexi bacterium]|nr:MAG: hypothetical protein CSB13_09775 [Chloroflexota bacterium]